MLDGEVHVLDGEVHVLDVKEGGGGPVHLVLVLGGLGGVRAKGLGL